MAIALRSYVAAMDYQVTTSVGKPAGLAVGDAMVAFALVRSKLVAPSSWTEQPSDDGFTVLDTCTAGYSYLRTYWKVADAADVAGSGWSLNATGSDEVQGLAVLAFTGVDTSSPITDSGTAFDDSWTAAAQISTDLSITTVAGDMLIFYAWAAQNRTHSGWATGSQNPSSWTEDFDAYGSVCAHAAAHGLASGAGATGNWQVLRSSTARWNVAGIALAEAGPATVAQTLDASYHICDEVAETLDASYHVAEAVAETLDGSYGIWELVAETLDASYEIEGPVAQTLDASYHVCGLIAQVLNGSYHIREPVAASFDATYSIHPAGSPAAEPKLLYVPQLALLVDDANSVPIDLLAEGFDPESVRFGNAVIGGHGRLTAEAPQGPSRLVANGIHRGMDAALHDRGRKLHEGVVLSVAGQESGDGLGTTTLTIGGPLELSELDKSFRWTWVDAEYAAWEQVAPPIGPLEYAGNTHEWKEAPWEVRTDGELFLGVVRGATYPGDAFYRTCPRVRIAYVVDRRLWQWPSGSYSRLGGIAAFRADWRADTGTKFRARVMRAVTPWCDSEGWTALLTETGNGSASGNDAEWGINGDPVIIVELALYWQADAVGEGEHIQLLHPRVLVAPEGPGSRSWSVGDPLPRLDQCISDVMADPDGKLATSVEAEEIGEGLEHAVGGGPTRTEALDQLAEYDEDEDGSGQPLEYGIWDDRVGLIRRRGESPSRKDEWLAIDTSRDDVEVRVEYEDSDAPDYVEVRYAYRRTNLLRHSSPAAAGYWETRGYPDDLPYDWEFATTGMADYGVATDGGERRYKLHAGPGTNDEAQAAFPKDGKYPVEAVDLTAGYGDRNATPFLADTPLRFQVWARALLSGSGWAEANAWYRLDADNPRGSDAQLVMPDSATWQLWRADWRPDPTSLAREMSIDLRARTGGASGEATLFWRNAQLYYLIPDGVELSAWWPEEPSSADASVETYDLPAPATLWQARNSARRFYASFARGAGKGTISARGILHDMRGREVPVSRIRGGWWASIVDDPRCISPLYVSSIECSPYGLETELGIGGELPPWSARRSLRERRTFGRRAEWREMRPKGRRR